MTELDDALQELVRIYATDLDEEPETRADYQAIDQAYGSRDDFKRTRSVLRKHRGTIAGLKATSARHQAIGCLHVIKEASSPLYRAALRQLALAAFASQWAPNQVARFGAVAAALVDGYDYFLSFTGRNPLRQQAILRVNREYEELISKVLDGKWISQANLTEDNLLAASVHALLTEKVYQGFYYPDRRGDSAQVRAKLKEACSLSLCFVQLLDNEMFAVKQTVDENYCYWEYNRALDNQLSMLFLFPYADRNQLLAASQRHEDLDEWYQKVSGADLRILPLARVTERANLAQIYQRIDDLAAQIRVERNTAIESIPAA